MAHRVEHCICTHSGAMKTNVSLLSWAGQLPTWESHLSFLSVAFCARKLGIVILTLQNICDGYRKVCMAPNILLCINHSWYNLWSFIMTIYHGIYHDDDDDKCSLGQQCLLGLEAIGSALET